MGEGSDHASAGHRGAPGGGRRYTPLDRLVIDLDQALRTLRGRAGGTGRPSPAAAEPPDELPPGERRRVAALVRVDHAGEVAAQALYRGQAATARTARLRARLEEAAREEGDHLRWCRERLAELRSRPSVLDPLWYAGAWTIGAAAGLAGDRVSLGFLAETERQVVAHLDRHLAALPRGDRRTRVMLERMREDEGEHARDASAAGGAPLPGPVRRLMAATARIMTGTAAWL